MKMNLAMPRHEKNTPTPLQMAAVLAGVAVLLVLGPACGLPMPDVHRPQPLPKPPAPPDISSVTFDAPVRLVKAVEGGYGVKAQAFAVSPDGQRLYTTEANCVADRKFSNLEWSYDASDLCSDKPTHLAVSTNGTRLAASLQNGTIAVIDARQRKIIKILGTKSPAIRTVTFSPDGNHLATAGDDKIIHVWAVASGEEMARIKGHEESITSLSYSPDGKLLLSGSDDRTAKLWDMTATKLKTSFSRVASVWAVKFSPDGKSMAIAEAGGSITVTDLAGHILFESNEIRDGSFLNVVFTLDGNHLLAGSDLGIVVIFDLQGKSKPRAFSAHQGPVSALVLSPDGYRIATGGSDQMIRLWTYQP